MSQVKKSKLTKSAASSRKSVAKASDKSPANSAKSAKSDAKSTVNSSVKSVSAKSTVAKKSVVKSLPKSDGKEETIHQHFYKKRVFFGLVKDDLEYTPVDELEEKIHSQSHFSLVYFLMLITSVLVCTLGLLTNSTAVVIGGMLIAPLTWPLSRIGFGVARREPHHIVRGVLLVAASILIGTLSAYLITMLSPIKVLNEEILARTQPTLMDLFIALAAGILAAFALTQRKIADSLAGVAIAVSLMPPLCAVGITTGLRSYSSAAGALLLFAVNAAGITLMSAIIISFTIYLRTKRFNIAMRATVINAVFLLILAVPLAYFLARASFETQSYDRVNTVLTNYAEYSETAVIFENVEVSPKDKTTLAVSAVALLPSY